MLRLLEIIFEPTYKSRGYQGDDQEELNYLNQIPDNQTSLFEHPVEQIHLNYRDTYLRQLVFFLVEYIDVNGYLTITLEEMMSQTGAEYLQALDAPTLLRQLEPAVLGLEIYKSVSCCKLNAMNLLLAWLIL